MESTEDHKCPVCGRYYHTAETLKCEELPTREDDGSLCRTYSINWILYLHTNGTYCSRKP